ISTYLRFFMGFGPPRAWTRRPAVMSGGILQAMNGDGRPKFRQYPSSERGGWPAQPAGGLLFSRVDAPPGALRAPPSPARGGGMRPSLLRAYSKSAESAGAHAQACRNSGSPRHGRLVFGEVREGALAHLEIGGEQQGRVAGHPGRDRDRF